MPKIRINEYDMTGVIQKSPISNIIYIPIPTDKAVPLITKNGKVVAKLTNPHRDRVEVAKSLFGILPKDADLNEAKEERLGAK